jgi:hypothetical protein
VSDAYQSGARSTVPALLAKGRAAARTVATTLATVCATRVRGRSDTVASSGRPVRNALPATVHARAASVDDRIRE